VCGGQVVAQTYHTVQDGAEVQAPAMQDTRTQAQVEEETVQESPKEPLVVEADAEQVRSPQIILAVQSVSRMSSAGCSPSG